MHAQLTRSAIHQMLLELGNVVAHIVDHLHIEVVGCGVEHFGECLKIIFKKI